MGEACGARARAGFSVQPLAVTPRPCGGGRGSPFDFSSQIHFTVDHKLYPGDSLTTTCRFNNTTDRGVPFGESSDTEMCYMFTYAWPANTLENGAESLIGA